MNHVIDKLNQAEEAFNRAAADRRFFTRHGAEAPADIEAAYIDARDRVLHLRKQVTPPPAAVATERRRRRLRSHRQP